MTEIPHAIKRCKERYGIWLKAKHLDHIVAQCREGKAILAGTVPGGKIYLVRLPNGKPAKAVIGDGSDTIITFLDMSMASHKAPSKRGATCGAVSVAGRGAYKRKRFSLPAEDDHGE